jgi:hypothetical protein
MDAASHRRGTAYHEAGHAVVAWALKLDVLSILVREMGNGNSETRTTSACHLSLTDHLAVLAAGKEAEKVFDRHLPAGVGLCDRLQAINLILKFHAGLSSDEIESHLIEGHANACRLLIANWDRVGRVARRLCDVREIGADEFLQLINPSMPGGDSDHL